jgi:hypothetical protein
MHVRKLSAREPGDPTFDLAEMVVRSAQRIPRERGCDERAWEVGQANSTEEAAKQRWARYPLAEAVEERGLTKGNPLWHNKLRALNRERGEDEKI